MVSGDRARVLSAATTEKAPELRQEAVRQLGVMGAREELWQLYQREPVGRRQEADPAGDVRRRRCRAPDRSGQRRAEPGPALHRGAAARHDGTRRTGDALVSLYAKEKGAAVKRQVINSLFVQDNAESLVALARKESDPQMKKEIVQKLSLMKSKVAPRLPDGDPEQMKRLLATSPAAVLAGDTGGGTAGGPNSAPGLPRLVNGRSNRTRSSTARRRRDFAEPGGDGSPRRPGSATPRR